jgi:hypothetical protein
MTHLGCGVLETRPYIRGLKIGKVSQDCLLAGTPRQHIQDVFDADTHAANARAAAALLGIKSNPVKIVHTPSLPPAYEGSKRGL